MTVRGSIPGRGKEIFYVLQTVQTGSGAPQPPIQRVAGSFCGSKASGAWCWHLHIALRFGVSGAVPLFPLYAFMALRRGYRKILEKINATRLHKFTAKNKSKKIYRKGRLNPPKWSKFLEAETRKPEMNFFHRKHEEMMLIVRGGGGEEAAAAASLFSSGTAKHWAIFTYSIRNKFNEELWDITVKCTRLVS